MRYSSKIFGAVLILALASLLVVLPSDMARPASQSDLRSASGVPVANQVQQESPSSDFFASEPVTPSVTLAASELPAYVVEYTLDREINPRLSYNSVVDPNFNPAGGPDPLLVVQELAPAAQPNAFGTPLLNFNGQGYTGVNPPDTVGDVGPNHYVQMINGGGGALVQIYNKATGAPIGSQFALNDLATSGPCQTGMGDPIVLYDKLADRWLLSEFASYRQPPVRLRVDRAEPWWHLLLLRLHHPHLPGLPQVRGLARCVLRHQQREPIQRPMP